jgi:hypothetical protein
LISDRQREYRKAIDHLAETISARSHLRPPGLNYAARRFLRDLRRKAIRSPIFMYLILFLLGVGGAYVTRFLSRSPALHSPTFYLGVPAILLGAYQAWLTSVIKQADQMKDYMGRLFSEDLFRTWYELFYNYPNTEFDRLDALALGEREKALVDVNSNRRPGTRRWHPWHLWGTQEEGMIDALLSQLNILADYYERGLLSLTEIGGVAEFYFFGVLNCHAFQAYIYRIRQGFRGETKEFPWEKEADGDKGKTANRKKFGSPPYRHLCALLRDLDELRSADEVEIYNILDQAIRKR